MKINVISALYGFGSSSGTSLVDVTKQVTEICSGEISANVNILVDFTTFKIPDPAQYIRKTFVMIYTTETGNGIISSEIVRLGVDGDTITIESNPAGMTIPTVAIYGSGGRVYDISESALNYLNTYPFEDSISIDGSFKNKFCFGSDIDLGVPKSLFLKVNSPDMANSDLVCINDGETGNWNIENPVIRISVKNESLIGLNVSLKSSGVTPMFSLGPGEYGSVDCLNGNSLLLDAPNTASNKVIEIDSSTKKVFYSENDIKSASQQGSPVSVKFENNYHFSLYVYQIDSTGRIQDYPTQLPNQGSTTIQSFSGSVLKIFTQDTGQEVFVYSVSTENTQTCVVAPQSKSSLPCFLKVFSTRKNSFNILFVSSDGSETLAQSSLANGDIWEQKSTVGCIWIARDSVSNELVSFIYSKSEEMTVDVHEFWTWEKSVVAMQAISDIRDSQFAYFPLSTISGGSDGLCRWSEGTVGPTVVFNGDGNFGYAGLFINQQSYISFAPELEKYYVEGSYSLSCWIKVHGLPDSSNQAVIVGSLRIDSYGDIQYGFPYMNTPGGEILEYIVPFPAVIRPQKDQWQSIVLSYNSSTKICKIYLEGINHGYVTIPDDIADKEILLPTNPGIGGSADTQSGLTYFNGEISDVGFFDIALEDDHALVLANREDQFQDINHELAATILILLPIAVAAILIILVHIATAAQTVVQFDSIDPDYVKNKRLPDYNKQNIYLLDIWGEGRVEQRVSSLDTVRGFPNAYNLNREGNRVFVGGNIGKREIPNFIKVSNYEVGLDGKVPENSVKIMTSMNSKIIPKMANDMLRSLDQEAGIILLYSTNKAFRDNLETAIDQYKDLNGNQIFTKKEKTDGKPTTVFDLPGEFGKIRNSDNTVYVYAARKLTYGQVVNDLLREPSGDL